MDQTAGSVVARPDFTYWDNVDRGKFLSHDWANQSRHWATAQAVALALWYRSYPKVVEIGPGGGFDYRNFFRSFVKRQLINYMGIEGSTGLCAGLRSEFPEVAWYNQTLDELPENCADVLYVRHVLEHQPELEPALMALFRAAPIIVLTWYRPPSTEPRTDMNGAIHCHTFDRGQVMDLVSRSRHRITSSVQCHSGRDNGNNFDEVWVLQRT